MGEIAVCNVVSRLSASYVVSKIFAIKIVQSSRWNPAIYYAFAPAFNFRGRKDLFFKKINSFAIKRQIATAICWGILRSRAKKQEIRIRGGKKEGHVLHVGLYVGRTQLGGHN